MKNLCLLFAILLAIVGDMKAQDKTVQGLKNEVTGKTINKDPKDTIPKLWKKGGLYNLNFNQAALSNWSAGGDKSSLSLSTLLNLYAFYKRGKNSWDNTLNLAYGFVSTTSLGRRKADDRIDLLSNYGHELKKNWWLSTLFNFRSQFTKGFAYPSGSAKVLTSACMAPAYLLLSEGLDYKPNKHFSIFLSPVTVRFIIVNNDTLSLNGAFGVEPGNKVKFQLGAFASILYNTSFNSNTTYTTRADLFSNYLHKPQNLILYWTNILAVKVSKVINMNFSVDMIYDDNIKTVKSNGTMGGPTLQLKELLGIGLVVKF